MPDGQQNEQQDSQQTQRQFDKKHFLSGLAAGRMLQGFPFRRPDFVVTGAAGRPAERDGPVLTFHPWAERSRADPRFRTAAAETAMVDALAMTLYRYGLDAAGGVVWQMQFKDILQRDGGYMIGNYHTYGDDTLTPPIPLSGSISARYGTISYTLSGSGTSMGFRFERPKRENFSTADTYRFSFTVKAPCTGAYTALAGRCGTYTYDTYYMHEEPEDSGNWVPDARRTTDTYTWNYTAGNGFGSFLAGEDATLYLPRSVERHGSPPRRTTFGSIQLPAVWIRNASLAWGPRAGDINGHFGILGENDTLLPLTETTRIVDEANRAVYDPFDRTWYSVSNYIYDYETRTYYMNLSDSMDPSSASIVVAFHDASVSFSRAGSGGDAGSAGTIYYIALDIGQDAFLQGVIVGSRLREWAMARHGTD